MKIIRNISSRGGTGYSVFLRRTPVNVSTAILDQVYLYLRTLMRILRKKNGVTGPSPTTNIRIDFSKIKSTYQNDWL